MPSYESPGTSNMRADQTTKSAGPAELASAAGKATGGTDNLRANNQTFRAGFHDTPSGTDHRPAGVQNFDGMAKEGGR